MSLRAARLGPAVVLAAVVLAGAPAVAQPQPQGVTPAAMRSLAREVAQEYAHRAAQAERDGRPHSAQDLYGRAITADPGYLPGHLGYARVLAARGHADEALHAVLNVPPRAVESDPDFVALARQRAALGDVDGALGFLAARDHSVPAARARVELASGAGRFPEALAAARAALELARGTDDERGSALLVRALLLVVADADAVRYPGAGASLLRRLLAAQ